jgi:hypothetical protein
MALSRGDDYPIHQTPDPVAYAGTDRNFYDRYFFNGYAPDGSGFFAAAFGVYPHLDVADAHFCVVRNGVQHCLHASRHLGMERMALECGPIRIEIIQPLQQLRVIVDGEGIAADITFTGRAFPIEEPRFTWRVGPRTVMDYTRLTQNGHYDGWIEVDGAREALPSGSMGTRDRSWGVRPIGAADPQFAGRSVPQFFWQWTPINMGARSIFFHLNAHADGTPWNTRAVIVPDGAGPQGLAEHHAGLRQACLRSVRKPSASRRFPASRCVALATPRPDGATGSITARWRWSARTSFLPTSTRHGRTTFTSRCFAASPGPRAKMAWACSNSWRLAITPRLA